MANVAGRYIIENGGPLKVGNALREVLRGDASPEQQKLIGGYVEALAVSLADASDLVETLRSASGRY